MPSTVRSSFLRRACGLLLLVLVIALGGSFGTRSANAATVVLYQNDFESPLVPLTANCAPDFDARNVNTLFGPEFKQQNTVETLLINGPANLYNDPSGIGGNNALGMLSSVQNDKLGLTFNTQGLGFLNLKLDISAIDVAGCGGPFGLAAPVFKLDLVDSPGGAFAFGSGTILDSTTITGVPATAGSYTFTWANRVVGLDTSGSVDGRVTLVFDLLQSGYAALDNISIVASDTSGVNDADLDGVIDANDICPATTLGLAVAANGCPTVAGIVAVSNNPANGGFAENDLTGMGLNNVVAANVPLYEAAIASANPAPITLAELQAIIDQANASLANNAPTASAGSLTTLEDTPASGMLAASDVDGDPLMYSLVTNGTKGVAVVTDAGTGAFTYTPNANANGADSFTFKANDGTANSNVATINITITPTNDAPALTVASPTVTVNEGQTAANSGTFTDIDSSNVTFSANVGSMTANSNNLLIPDLTTGGRWRTASVLKSADADGNNIYGTDGYGMWGLAGVQTVVNPAYASITRNAALSFYPGNGSYLNIDNPSNPLGPQLRSGVIYNAPGGTNPTVFLTVSFSQARTVRMGILVDNADFAPISPATLRLRQTVGGTLDTGYLQAGTGASRNRSVDYYFFDIVAKAGDSFELSGNSDPGHGSNGVGGVFFDTKGWDWSYATTDGSAQSQIVTITADDGAAATNLGTANFQLVVNNVAPSATFNNGGAVNKGSSGSVSFSAPSDPSSVDTAAGFHYAYDFDNDGIFEIGDGSYAGSDSSATAVVPASYLSGAGGSRVVRGRIIDKDNGFTDYTTTITIINAVPSASKGSLTMNEDMSASSTLSATDGNGDTLTYSIVGGPSKGVLTSFDAATGAFTYTPNANTNGMDSFTFKANDGTADSNVAVVDLAISPVNDAPSFVVGANQTVTATSGPQTIAGWASGFTPGPADEASQTVLGYTVVSNSNPALFNVMPAVATNGTLTYTPKPAANGTATIGVTARDSGGTANGGADTSAIKTFTITVGTASRLYMALMMSSGTPDLVVTSIDLSPNQASRAAGEPVEIAVVVENRGSQAAGPFWVDLSINPNQPPTTANQPWNEHCALSPCYGLAWYVQGLAPGARVTLTSTQLEAGYSIWPGWFAAGTTDLYAYVDTYNPGVLAGAVSESDETNNQLHLGGLTVMGKNPASISLQSVVSLQQRPVRLR
jgi:hypothetical protein